MTGMLAMDSAGYVFGSYAAVLVAVGGFTWRMLRRGRQLSQQVDDADKYWH